VRAGLDDERLTVDRMYAFADRAPPGAVDVLLRYAPWAISPSGADYSWIPPLMQAGLRITTPADSGNATAAAADELLDGLLDRSDFDLVGDYALPLMGWMLADFLGGDRRDGPRLMQWALDLAAFFNNPALTVARTERMGRSLSEMVAYGQGLLTTSQNGGFLELAREAAKNHGRVLDDEGIGNITLPFLTGQVGVAHLIANAVWLLLQHPDQAVKVTADPDLLPGAIAETMRYLSPIALVPRIALEPIALDGQTVERGETIQFSLAASNRDPARFPDPERFDITRSQAGAVGFGHGAHSCLAAGLARRQAASAVRALLRRAPGLTPDAGSDPVWSEIPGVQALDTFRVRPPR
jgi:cytochrome P450